jgi:serine phosphatase RsbU (regulator of sigma subunit)
VLAVDAVEDTVLAGEGMHAALGASLAAEGRAPGLLVIADRVPRDWTELERRLVQLAADRLGHVFERTRIADEQHDVAERLQRALEPTELPRRPGVRLAARYRPAERRIGGDWYDAFALPGGRVGIAIGDVVGHGIAAAAAAVRLRHFLRGCVLEGLEPGEALAALDAQVASEPDAAYSSVIYGVLDPGARTLVWASAGHPPPVLLRDGAARPLKSRGGSLLGVRPTGEWPESRLDLRDGDRIVLYTDGLVERPGVPIDEDIAAVFAPMGEEDDLERLCHGLVAARSAPARDDVAVLAVRVG